MVVWQVSGLMGNSKFKVMHSTLWIDWTMDNYTWGGVEMNFWTNTSSKREITFCSRNLEPINPNIFAMLSLEIWRTICECCSKTIDLDSGEKCSAHYMTSSGKWKTCRTTQRCKPEFQTWKQTIGSSRLPKKCMGKS